MNNLSTPNLYPRETSTREVKDLSGIWNILFDFDDKGDAVYARVKKIPAEAHMIAVPGSYNDQIPDKKIRDFVGKVYYYRELHIPRDAAKNYFLRFNSVNYTANVYLDGELIGEHSGGHLPFTVAIPESACGKKVLLAVSVDNNLSWETIPPGVRVDYTIEKDGIDKKRLDYGFDFFHYCGIHRRVLMLSTPKTYLADLTVITKDIGNGDLATLSYSLDICGNASEVKIKLIDDEEIVLELEGCEQEGEISVPSPKLWEVGKGGLYDFVVELYDENHDLIDSSLERIGIRTVRVDGVQFLVNEKPVYFKGFGWHEDFIISGRSLPDAVLIHDFELMKWSHANSFRTSHYPYSEETMMLADEMGFMVIDETPAVGLNKGPISGFNVAGGDNGKDVFDLGLIAEKTLEVHAQVIRDLVRRDKNRACVVMWSIANESANGDEQARPYFEKLYKLTKELDRTRPVTAVTHKRWFDDKVIDIYDVICLNRYFSWYSDGGEIEAIGPRLKKDLDQTFERCKKPMFISEFGADTIHGFHSLPDAQFSEEFQSEYLKAFFEVLEKHEGVIGEHIWVFADFATKQESRRALGNRKGIFTRDRKPKMAAFTVREHWEEK